MIQKVVAEIFQFYFFRSASFGIVSVWLPTSAVSWSHFLLWSRLPSMAVLLICYQNCLHWHLHGGYLVWWEKNRPKLLTLSVQWEIYLCTFQSAGPKNRCRTKWFAILLIGPSKTAKVGSFTPSVYLSPRRRLAWVWKFCMDS